MRLHWTCFLLIYSINLRLLKLMIIISKIASHQSMAFRVKLRVAKFAFFFLSASMSLRIDWLWPRRRRDQRTNIQWEKCREDVISLHFRYRINWSLKTVQPFAKLKCVDKWTGVSFTARNIRKRVLCFAQLPFKDIVVHHLTGFNEVQRTRCMLRQLCALFFFACAVPALHFACSLT